MTIELAQLVRDMRAAQKAYFRTRTPDALARSKDLERAMDMAIKEILDPAPAMLPGMGADDMAAAGEAAFESGDPQAWADWNAAALDFGD